MFFFGLPLQNSYTVINSFHKQNRTRQKAEQALEQKEMKMKTNGKLTLRCISMRYYVAYVTLKLQTINTLDKCECEFIYNLSK